MWYKKYTENSSLNFSDISVDGTASNVAPPLHACSSEPS